MTGEPFIVRYWTQITALLGAVLVAGGLIWKASVLWSQYQDMQNRLTAACAQIEVIKDLELREHPAYVATFYYHGAPNCS